MVTSKYGAQVLDGVLSVVTSKYGAQVLDGVLSVVTSKYGAQVLDGVLSVVTSKYGAKMIQIFSPDVNIPLRFHTKSPFCMYELLLSSI